MVLNKMVERLRDGDVQYFEDVYKATKRRVFFIVTRYIKDDDTVKDIVQETYVSALNNIDSMTDNNIQPWLNTIARNKSLDYLKKKKPMLFGDFDPISFEDDYQFEIKDETLDFRPKEVSERVESNRLLDNIIKGLPDDQRVCIMMFYFDQLTSKEIAEILEVSENSVKSRLRYGKMKIKDEVEGLESKGVKLYGYSPLAFFMFLLRDSQKHFEVPAQFTDSEDLTGNILSQSKMKGDLEIPKPKLYESIKNKVKVVKPDSFVSTFTLRFALIAVPIIGVTAFSMNAIIKKVKEPEIRHELIYEIEYDTEFDASVVEGLYDDYELLRTLENEQDGLPVDYTNEKALSITRHDFATGKKELYYFVIEVDTTPPETVQGEDIFILPLNSAVSFENAVFTIVDKDGKSLYSDRFDYQKDDRGQSISYEFLGEIDTSKEGKYTAQMIASDPLGNSKSKDILFKVFDYDVFTYMSATDFDYQYESKEMWMLDNDYDPNSFTTTGNMYADEALKWVGKPLLTEHLIGTTYHIDDDLVWTDKYDIKIDNGISVKKSVWSIDSVLKQPFWDEVNDMQAGDLIYWGDGTEQHFENNFAIALSKDTYVFVGTTYSGGEDVQIFRTFDDKCEEATILRVNKNK